MYKYDKQLNKYISNYPNNGIIYIVNHVKYIDTDVMKNISDKLLKMRSLLFESDYTIDIVFSESNYETDLIDDKYRMRAVYSTDITFEKDTDQVLLMDVDINGVEIKIDEKETYILVNDDTVFRTEKHMFAETILDALIEIYSTDKNLKNYTDVLIKHMNNRDENEIVRYDILSSNINNNCFGIRSTIVENEYQYTLDDHMKKLGFNKTGFMEYFNENTCINVNFSMIDSQLVGFLNHNKHLSDLHDMELICKALRDRGEILLCSKIFTGSVVSKYIDSNIKYNLHFTKGIGFVNLPITISRTILNAMNGD